MCSIMEVSAVPLASPGVQNLHGVESIAFWSDTMRSRASQLAEIPSFPPDFIHTTPDGVAAAERTICDARAALRAQIEREAAAVRLALEELHRACAEREEAMRAALLAVRQQHNSRLTAACLLPEILAIIFSYVSRSFLKKRVWDDEFAVDLRWLAVTHVCQRWRQVAIECPLLWTEIDFSYGHRWTEVFLARSRTAPLTISSILPLTAAGQKNIAQNIGRTCALTVKSSHQVLALVEPATLLHKLELHSAEPLPDDLFSKCAPVLREMQLVTPSPPWKSPLLTNLTHLTMRSSVGHHPYVCPPLDQVFDVLAKMHALEALQLELAMTSADLLRHGTSHSASHRIVSLASIRRLRLLSNLTITRAFLAHLALPSQVHVRCDIISTAGPVRDIAAVLSTVQASIKHDTASKKPISIVELDIKENNEVARDRQTFDLEARAWQKSRNDKPSITVRFVPQTGTGRNRGRRVSSTLKAFSSKHLKTLYISCDNEDPAWMDIVGDTPRLGCVVAGGKAASTLCNALRPSDTGAAEAPAGNSPQLLLLPALSHLTIRVDKAFGTGSPLADTLPMSLAERARLGCLLKELTLDAEGGELPMAWIYGLKAAVPGMVVNWRDEGRCQNSEEGLVGFATRLMGGLV
ncbi:hypothetical protein FA95DRAFT_94404 [Auriscalpium vulgare]|uniref:Uncharacterized protein n=1 Tax=Auriscalpium vulgare TaxID=40419 RepID=A0ACB8RQ91_9AGAM|nr:hypothetical protein FA95DRAFT_94404 [Auriscalpium vulgare]